MAEHHATITWNGSATPDDFTKGKYARDHLWQFDSGFVIPASPSPSVVPPPYSNPAYVDPEEAFVASVSSCHMLTFLHLASKRGFAIARYRDAAFGVLTKGDNGVPWISKITLAPDVTWSGARQPTAAELAELHHEAHVQCFISSSIKSEVVVVPAAPA